MGDAHVGWNQNRIEKFGQDVDSLAVASKLLRGSNNIWFLSCVGLLASIGQNFSRVFYEVTVMKYGMLIGARGGLGSIVGWFIRIVIYDICITGISDLLGVTRMVAVFIFLGILVAIALGGYILKQRVAPGVED